MSKDLDRIFDPESFKPPNQTLGSQVFRNGACVLLSAAIAFYVFYPLLSGEYVYGGTSEYELYKSFLVNFINTLKNYELPVWNEYIGGGHAAICLGHYPITQNTLVYMLFGVNDFTYAFTKCLNLIILLVSFVYASKIIKFNFLVAFLGALVYLNLNLVIRFIIADTEGNLLPLYPLLVFFVAKIVMSKSKNDLLFFSLFYICWLSGSHITYVFPHTVMLFIIYWVAVLINHKRDILNIRLFGKYTGIFLVIFAIPWLTVLYQYYFVYDVIVHSNRMLSKGLLVSPFEAIGWKQLIESFKSSSYFWISTILGFIYLLRYLLKDICINRIRRIARVIWKPLLVVIFFLLLILTSLEVDVVSTSNLLVDYVPILNSSIFRTALLIYIFIHMFLNKGKRDSGGIALGDCTLFIVFVSLLSYYVYAPGNIAGYDYDFFKELSRPFQVLFTVIVLYSLKDYRENKLVRIVVLSAIALYLIRSHVTIPLLRFTGIIWYAVRDGSIFSLFFAILFMTGLTRMMEDLAVAFEKVFNGDRLRRQVFSVLKYSFLIAVLLLMVHDSENKFYEGKSNRLIYPNKLELVKTEKEKQFLFRREELALLTKELLGIQKETTHFQRIFTADVPDWSVLAGNWQQYGVYDAAIYDSSISNGIKAFFDSIILQKTTSPVGGLKNVLQCGVFTRHVHKGLRVKYGEVTYSDIFGLLLFPQDIPYFKEENVDFYWDLMQVKYLVVGPFLSELLQKSQQSQKYGRISHYPMLNMNTFEIKERKDYATHAILPIRKEEGYEKAVGLLNSPDIAILKSMYSRLLYTGSQAAQNDYRLLNIQRSGSRRYYEIEAASEAILVEFENTDHSWKAIVNNEEKPLEKVFHNLKGVRIEPGLNRIEFSYHVKYFHSLFGLAVIVFFAYLVLLGRSLCKKKVNKTE